MKEMGIQAELLLDGIEKSYCSGSWLLVSIFALVLISSSGAYSLVWVQIRRCWVYYKRVSQHYLVDPGGKL